MHDSDNHPSQAEGEDPSRPPSGGGSGETGHPSQAEGEDPVAGSSLEAAASDAAASPSDATDDDA